MASGAPNEQAITLWTRLEGPRRDRRVVLEVAKDPGFRKVVTRRNVRVSTARDNTVETRVRSKKLRPGTQIMSLELSQGAQITKDSWDGYGVERRELMGFHASNGIPNVSFMTGDIHTFFAGDAGLDGRGPESHATEFVGGSVTSLGVPETVRGSTGAPLTNAQIVLLTNNLKTSNPHLRYTEQESRGYGVLEAGPNELRVQFKGVPAMNRGATARTIGSFVVARGTQRVQVL